MFVLALLGGLWLLSQLTVATWLTQDAARRESDWAQGLSPWRWNPGDPHAVVRPGSHGLESARNTPAGLDVILPADGIANLSLALRGERIDTAAVSLLQIELETDAPLRLMLLADTGGTVAPWLDTTLEAGRQARDLALDSLRSTPDGMAPRLDALFLRLHSAPGSRIVLRTLALRTGPCTGPACPGHSRTAPFFPAPERLLAWRDVQRAEQPAMAFDAGGWPGALARRIAVYAPAITPSTWSALALIPGVLLLSALARHRTTRRRRPPPAALVMAELALCLGLPLALLVAGWPARNTPGTITLSFVACLAALALLPAPNPPRWRWFGDRHAWSATLIFTALIALLLTPLGWLDHGASAPRDATRWLRYPLWALLQQWLLLAAIAPRLRHLIPDARFAALACGAIFGLLHTPNFALMAFTCAGGTAWAWLGWRHRALLPLASSHAALGLWLVHLAPTWLLRSAEIGGRYLMAP